MLLSVYRFSSVQKNTHYLAKMGLICLLIYEKLRLETEYTSPYSESLELHEQRAPDTLQLRGYDG